MTEEYGNKNSGSGMFIVVILIIGAFFAYQYYQGDSTPRTSEPTYNEDTQTFSRTEEVVENDTVPDEEPTVVTNACGYETFGFPDYDGTNKEGDTCADALPSQRNNECLSNPPTNYDGLINLAEGYSDPPLLCCSLDGTCEWS